MNRRAATEGIDVRRRIDRDLEDIAGTYPAIRLT